MERHLSYSAAAVSAIVLSAAFPSFAAPDPGQAGEETEAFSETQAAYQQGTLNGLTFSNPWADYSITFPEGTYFNPDSLVDYMSAYTGLDYEFAANLYGDLTDYPSMNITFQDALIPLKDCTQNLLDIYAEKEYECQTKTGVWIAGHPFTRVLAESPEYDVYVDNYLRVKDGKLIWISIKCPKDDAEAQETVKQVLYSATSFNK